MDVRKLEMRKPVDGVSLFEVTSEKNAEKKYKVVVHYRDGQPIVSFCQCEDFFGRKLIAMTLTPALNIEPCKHIIAVHEHKS